MTQPGPDHDKTDPGAPVPKANGSSDDALIAAARAAAEARSDGLPPEANLPAPDYFPGYVVVREIHRGGQGVVYQAIHKGTKRKVAIKVMIEGALAGPRERTRFEREVEILAELHHPNIVEVLDSGSVEERFYYVMDYISGVTLDVHISNRNLTMPELLALFVKICDAVNAAHLKGVIHRDLKPANVRVDASGEPHIVDFGLAKIAGGEVSGAHRLMSMTGQFIGSLPWASPEQAQGQPSMIDTRTDVYALGVMLYQMLTGRFPYQVIGNMRDVLDNILRAEPARPSTIRRQINDEVETIVLKCLSKERDRRYQNAGELARDLGHYLRGEPIEAKRDSGWYVLRKTARRYRGPVAAGMAFIVLLGVTSVVMSWLYGQKSRAESRATIALNSLKAETLAKDRALAEARDQSVSKQEIIDTMEKWFTAPNPELGQGRDVTVYDVASSVAATIADDLKGKPRVEAPLRGVLGQTFRALGDLDAAEEQLRASLPLYQRHYGPDHEESIWAESSLGVILLNQHMLDESRALLTSSLERARRVLGTSHDDTLILTQNLARCLGALKLPDQAEALYREALSLAGESADQEVVAAIELNLGDTLTARGELVESERLVRSAIARFAGVHGPEHVMTAKARLRLARFLGATGKTQEAEGEYRAVRAALEAKLGEAHPDVLGTRVFLAAMWEKNSRLDDAAAEMREVAALAGSALKPEDVTLALYRQVLGRVLVAAKQLDEAETVLLAAYPVLDAAGHPRHVDAARSLVQLYEARGDEESAATYRAKLPPG